MWRRACLFLEVVLLSALVLATRCANSADVFVGGDIYFTDADCYSRMTRARMCFEHRGLVVRRQQFENFPAGTTAHTTAPFDYAIVGLAILLRPFSGRALELAGAWISPVLALGGAWFLWWWLRRMGFRFRAAALFLFAASPILVHATELGRPDHQSLALELVLVALCAEWTVHLQWSRAWDILSALAWGFALWVSIYEPLIIFLVVMISRAVMTPRDIFSVRRRRWWIVLATVVAIACATERRGLDLFPLADYPALKRWLGTIGELQPMPLSSGTWLEWCGYVLPVAPLLVIVALRRHARLPLFVLAVALATFCLTWWQARWGYFFVAILGLSLPALLSSLRIHRAALSSVMCVSCFPILQAWDAAIWPNESLAAQRVERRREAIDFRRAAAEITSGSSLLAPWWLTPALVYWSNSAGVAGSSHEALPGIVDTADFFVSSDPEVARQILSRRQVCWVVSYDADRVLANASAILGMPSSQANSVARILDRNPSAAPAFLVPVYANGTCKLFRAHISREKTGFP